MTTTSVPCDLLPFVLISGRTSSPSSPPSCILTGLAYLTPRLDRGMLSLGLRLCMLLPWPRRALGRTEGMENPDVSHAMQAATAHTIVRISKARDQMQRSDATRRRRRDLCAPCEPSSPADDGLVRCALRRGFKAKTHGDRLKFWFQIHFETRNRPSVR